MQSDNVAPAPAQIIAAGKLFFPFDGIFCAMIFHPVEIHLRNPRCIAPEKNLRRTFFAISLPRKKKAERAGESFWRARKTVECCSRQFFSPEKIAAERQRNFLLRKISPPCGGMLLRCLDNPRPSERAFHGSEKWAERPGWAFFGAENCPPVRAGEFFGGTEWPERRAMKFRACLYAESRRNIRADYPNEFLEAETWLKIALKKLMSAPIPLTF